MMIPEHKHNAFVERGYRDMRTFIARLASRPTKPHSVVSKTPKRTLSRSTFLILVGPCLTILLHAQSFVSCGTNICSSPASASVGIGTANPFGPLDLGPAAGIKQLVYGSGGSSGYQLGFGVDLGQAPNSFSAFIGGGANATFDIVSANQTTWPYSSFTSRLTVTNSGNVGIGTTSPAHLLHVAGTIGAEEVIVSTTGADYVFEPNYRMMPLRDVAAYIQQNHHLPDIPAAGEVQANGVSIGDMQMKLLAKVEELTLHVIEASEKSDRLEQQNHELLEENREIKKQLSELKREINK